jgi:hypothetical protein
MGTIGNGRTRHVPQLLRKASLAVREAVGKQLEEHDVHLVRLDRRLWGHLGRLLVHLVVVKAVPPSTNAQARDDNDRRKILKLITV